MSEKTSQTSNKQLPVETYQLMDGRDEDQILAEVRGEVLVLKDFVYEIFTEHGPVRNLSYAGVRALA